MRKRTLLIIAACIAVLLASSLLTLNLLHPQIPSKYEQIIARNANSPEEENALSAAESINYSAITSFERFRGSSDPEAYLNPGTYLEYTYADFIDSQVINYYESRYADLQGKGDPKQIELTYEANVTHFSDFCIYNSPAPQGASWHNNTIVMSTPNGSVAISRDYNQLFYKNQTGYQIAEWGYDFNFSDCYVVNMKLEYSEYYAPLAGFISGVDQIVVLDRDFSPVLVGLGCTNAIS